MSTLYLDLESFNTEKISVGTYRYAPSAEIMLVAYAWDDDEPFTWDLTYPGGHAHPFERIQAMINTADEVVCHNSNFERQVLKHNGVDLPVEKIVDTMVIALRHGLLGDLDKLCGILNVPSDLAKDKEGKKLINLFCSPCPSNWKIDRATRLTHPQEWERFISYAGMDIVSMREVRKRLPVWNNTEQERTYWLLDQQCNDRGFCVDADLATHAVRAFRKLVARLGVRTKELTGGAVGSTTERDKLLSFLSDNGCVLDDITKDTVSAALGTDLSPLVREILEMREQASRTTPSKYSALLKSMSDDGRLRGTLQYSGASRTNRDAGRIFNPQNLARTPDWFTHGVQEIVVNMFKMEAEDLVC